VQAKLNDFGMAFLLYFQADKLRAALLEYRETQSDVGSKTIESSTNFESVINCETNVDHQAEPLKPFESSEPSIDHELEKQMNMPLTEHESANILDSNTAATCGMTAGSIAEAVPSDESSEVNNMVILLVTSSDISVKFS
jgi:hypothetical protein